MSPGIGRPRRGPHDAAATAAVAIEIADAEGLEAVSIRRIAAALDARPMSFYDHFESKDELLWAMREEVVADVLGPLPEGWREGMATIARRIYVTLVRHPWIVAVFGRGPSFGPNSTAIAALWAQAVAELPLEADKIWLLVGTVNDYVLGHSARIAAAPRGRTAEEVIPEDLMPAAEMAVTPELAALTHSLRTRDSLERFEMGLAIVLDGIEKRLPD